MPAQVRLLKLYLLSLTRTILAVEPHFTNAYTLKMSNSHIQTQIFLILSPITLEHNIRKLFFLNNWLELRPNFPVNYPCNTLF